MSSSRTHRSVVVSTLWSWSLPLLAVLLALALCAGVLALAGQHPLAAGKALLWGAAGSKLRIAESLAKTIPLIFTGLGVMLAFRAGFWNIGAEGQFLVGALAATGAATKLGWPTPAALLLGMLAGALWALLAGVLKTRRGAPEIITTIMLNYVAVQLVAFSLKMPDVPGGPHGWLLEKTKTQPQSDIIPTSSQLSALITGTTFHSGIILALGCAALCWWLLFKTERGLLLRAAGAGPLVARTAGIHVDREILIGVALSGALCGLGGAAEICGATKQLGITPFNYGYTAIAVALLANLHPFGVLPAALLFGMLSAGGGAMERSANVPAVAVSIVSGVLVCLVALVPRLRKSV